MISLSDFLLSLGNLMNIKEKKTIKHDAKTGRASIHVHNYADFNEGKHGAGAAAGGLERINQMRRDTISSWKQYIFLTQRVISQFSPTTFMAQNILAMAAGGLAGIALGDDLSATES